MAWQKNLTTATVNLENYNNHSNNNKKSYKTRHTYIKIKNDYVNVRWVVGGWGGSGGAIPKLRNAGFPLCILL